MPNFPPVTALRLTPLLTTLALLGACADDSAGSVTDTLTSGGIETSTDASTATTTPTPTSEDPFVTDPTNPDTSVTHVTTGHPTTGEPSTSTTVDVTVTATSDGTTTTTGDDTTTTGGDTTTTGDDTTGDNTTGCDTGGPLCEIPPEEMVPTPKPDGLPGPLPGVAVLRVGLYDPDTNVRLPVTVSGQPAGDNVVLK